MAGKNAPKAVPSATPPGDAAEETPPPPKRGGKKRLLIILVLVVLLAGGGGASWFFFLRTPGPEPAEVAKPKSLKPPVFVNLEPFTVNLQPESGADQFLQLVTVLRVADEGVADQLKLFMPELRHKMLLLLSGKRASEISTPAGREKLADELREAINRVLAGNMAATKAPAKGAKATSADPAQVQSVFFTSFIVQ